MHLCKQQLKSFYYIWDSYHQESMSVGSDKCVVVTVCFHKWLKGESLITVLCFLILFLSSWLCNHGVFYFIILQSHLIHQSTFSTEKNCQSFQPLLFKVNRIYIKLIYNVMLLVHLSLLFHASMTTTIQLKYSILTTRVFNWNHLHYLISHLKSNLESHSLYTEREQGQPRPKSVHIW